MVRVVPVLTIDSLEDIPKRPQMKVLLRGDSALAQYVKLIDSDIGRAIKPKFITYLNFEEEVKYENLNIGLRNGSLAYVNTRWTLIFDLLRINMYNKQGENENFLDIIHISNDDESSEPYFTIVLESGWKWVLPCLNQM